VNPILKVASVVLVLYAICAGLLLPVPELPILGQTIRNLFYHVPMWFGMIFLLVAGVWNAINYLRKPDMNYDSKSEAYTQTAIFYGIMGLATGMIWAKKTWGTYWCLFGIKKRH
jgi:heme exporter protein C